MPMPNAHKLFKLIRNGEYGKLSPEEWKRDLSKLNMKRLRYVIELLDAPNRQGKNWDNLKDICIEAMLTQNQKKFLS